MKKIILLACLLTLNINAETTTKNKYSICDDISSLAKAIMINRQSGVSMSKMMGVAISPLALSIIKMAFSEPRLEYLKEDIAVNFSNKIHLECVTQIDDQK